MMESGIALQGEGMLIIRFSLQGLFKIQCCYKLQRVTTRHFEIPPLEFIVP